MCFLYPTYDVSVKLQQHPLYNSCCYGGKAEKTMALQPSDNGSHTASPRLAYTSEQIACICETLYRAKDYGSICHFFDYLRPEEYCSLDNPSVVRAHLLHLLIKGRFKEIYRILSSNNFDSDCHSELQEIWWQAHYMELEQFRCRPLGAVEKYRLRKKHPPPATIWDGEETVYSFKENSRQLLKQFYGENKYPTAEEKKVIADKCGLNFLQVSNWFKNRRQREKCCDPISRVKERV
ncbi:homeobox protein SIX4 [Trichuris trichiura]|uniref:Homeobox protein SIX4 n=1 Tax=Trichuris trichiura TaxID=36087 RepID=A0A077ZAZ8_TRITR|nr:homeobox protein SIX4 [Trichuris trichiura]